MPIKIAQKTLKSIKNKLNLLSKECHATWQRNSGRRTCAADKKDPIPRATQTNNSLSSHSLPCIYHFALVGGADQPPPRPAKRPAVGPKGCSMAAISSLPFAALRGASEWRPSSTAAAVSGAVVLSARARRSSRSVVRCVATAGGELSLWVLSGL